MRIIVFIIASIFGTGQLAGCDKAPVDYDLYESTPSLQLDATIEAQTATQLESLLAGFASTNSYELYIGRVHPKDPEFNVILFRRDSMIIGVNPFDLNAYKFGIYPALTDPPPDAEMNMTLGELEAALVTK